MANLALAPVVNAKLYRHFAAVTFAITLCVALFANGEARQVVGDDVDDQRQAAKLRDAEARKFGVKKLGDNRSNSSASFGSDFDPDYGAPSGGGSARRISRGYASGQQGAGAARLPAPDVLSPDEMASLSPEQQVAYLERLRRQGASPEEKQEVHDLAAIEAGSRARSGGSATD